MLSADHPSLSSLNDNTFSFNSQNDDNQTSVSENIDSTHSNSPQSYLNSAQNFAVPSSVSASLNVLDPSALSLLPLIYYSEAFQRDLGQPAESLASPPSPKNFIQAEHIPEIEIAPWARSPESLPVTNSLNKGKLLRRKSFKESSKVIKSGSSGNLVVESLAEIRELIEDTQNSAETTPKPRRKVSIKRRAAQKRPKSLSPPSHRKLSIHRRYKSQPSFPQTQAASFSASASKSSSFEIPLELINFSIPSSPKLVQRAGSLKRRTASHQTNQSSSKNNTSQSQGGPVLVHPARSSSLNAKDTNRKALTPMTSADIDQAISTLSKVHPKRSASPMAAKEKAKRKSAVAPGELDQALLGQTLTTACSTSLPTPESPNEPGEKIMQKPSSSEHFPTNRVKKSSSLFSFSSYRSSQNSPDGKLSFRMGKKKQSISLDKDRIDAAQRKPVSRRFSSSSLDSSALNLSSALPSPSPSPPLSNTEPDFIPLHTDNDQPETSKVPHEHPLDTSDYLSGSDNSLEPKRKVSNASLNAVLTSLKMIRRKSGSASCKVSPPPSPPHPEDQCLDSLKESNDSAHIIKPRPRSMLPKLNLDFEALSEAFGLPDTQGSLVEGKDGILSPKKSSDSIQSHDSGFEEGKNDVESNPPNCSDQLEPPIQAKEKKRKSISKAVQDFIKSSETGQVLDSVKRIDQLAMDSEMSPDDVTAENEEDFKQSNKTKVYTRGWGWMVWAKKAMEEKNGELTLPTEEYLEKSEKSDKNKTGTIRKLRRTSGMLLNAFLPDNATTEVEGSVDETTTATSPRSHPPSPSASPSLSPLTAASSTSDFNLEILHIDPDSPLLQDTMPLPLVLPPPSLSDALPLPPLSKLANEGSSNARPQNAKGLIMIPTMSLPSLFGFRNGKENLNVQTKSSSLLDAAVEQEVSSFESKRKSLLYGRPLPPIPQQAGVELDSSDKNSGQPLAIADTTSEAKSQSVSVRLSPILERFICKLAHQKLSHPKTHLRNQVLLSNMLIWYFSISASDAASDVVDLNMSTQAPTETSGLTDVFAKNGAPSVPVSGNFEPSDDTYTKGPDRPQPKMAVVWRNGRFRVVKPDQKADVDGISDKHASGRSSRKSRSGKRSRRKRSSHRNQTPNEPVKKVITMSGKVVYIGGSGPNSSSDSDGHHRRRKSKSKSKRYSKKSSSDSDSTSDSASPTSSSDSGSDSDTDSDSDSDNEEIYTDFHLPSSSSSSSDPYSFTMSPKRRNTQLTQKPLLSFTKDELSSVVYDPSMTDEPVDLGDDKVTTKEKSKEKGTIKTKTKTKLKFKKSEPKTVNMNQDDEDDEVPLGLMFASKKTRMDGITGC